MIGSFRAVAVCRERAFHCILSTLSCGPGARGASLRIFGRGPANSAQASEGRCHLPAASALGGMVGQKLVRNRTCPPLYWLRRMPWRPRSYLNLAAHAVMRPWCAWGFITDLRTWTRELGLACLTKGGVRRQMHSSQHSCHGG